MSSFALELRLRRGQMQRGATPTPRPTTASPPLNCSLFYLQLAPIDCLMAADCNKPIWSLHLNSKCEISSLAKRRQRRRPFALAPSLCACVYVSVCMCVCVNVPSRKCRQLPSAASAASLSAMRAQRTEASIGIAMFVLVVLVVCLSACPFV